MKKLFVSLFTLVLILFFSINVFSVDYWYHPDKVVSCGETLNGYMVNGELIGGYVITNSLNCDITYEPALRINAETFKNGYVTIYFNDDATIKAGGEGTSAIELVGDGDYYIKNLKIETNSYGEYPDYSIISSSGTEIESLSIDDSSLTRKTGISSTETLPGGDSYVGFEHKGINLNSSVFTHYTQIKIENTNFYSPTQDYYPTSSYDAINLYLEQEIGSIILNNNNFYDIPDNAIKVTGTNKDVDSLTITNNYFEGIFNPVYIYNINIIGELDSNYNEVLNTATPTGTLFYVGSVDNGDSTFNFQYNVFNSNNPTQLYFTGSAARELNINNNQFNTNGLPLSLSTSICVEESSINDNTANGYDIFFYLPDDTFSGDDWDNSQQVEFCGFSSKTVSNVDSSNIQNFRIRNSNSLNFNNVDIEVPNQISILGVNNLNLDDSIINTTDQISISNSDNVKFNNSIVEKTTGTDETFEIIESDNFGFYNGEILNSGTNKIRYNNFYASESYLYNISDIETKIIFNSGVDDDYTTVYLGKVLKTNITAKDGENIENANIVVKNESGSIAYTGTTDYNGEIAKTLFSHTKSRTGDGSYEQYSINATKEDYHDNYTTGITLPNDKNIANIEINQIPLFGKIREQPNAAEEYDTYVLKSLEGLGMDGFGNNDYNYLRLGYSNDYLYRSLLKFNLSQYSATESGLIDITGATLILTTKSSPSGDIDSEIYKTDSYWSQIITDFDATSGFIDGQLPADSVTINSGTAIDTQIQYDVTSIVENWIENGEENYGFLIKADNSLNYVDFYSADASTFTRDKLPKLIVEYTLKNYTNYEDTTITFNLSQFFYDDDELSYSYNYDQDPAPPDPRYTPVFNSPILTMTPDVGYTAGGYVDLLTFSASDSLTNAESSEFGIKTLEVPYPQIDFNNVHEYLIAEDPSSESSSISFTIPYIPGANDCYIRRTTLSGFRQNSWGQPWTLNCGEGEQTFTDTQADASQVIFYQIYTKTNAGTNKFNPHTFGKISYDLSTEENKVKLVGFPFYNLNVSNSSIICEYLLNEGFDLNSITNNNENFYLCNLKIGSEFNINGDYSLQLIFDSNTNRYLTLTGILNQTTNRTIKGRNNFITIPLNSSLNTTTQLYQKFNEVDNYKIKSISAYNLDGEVKRGTVYTPVTYVVDSILGETFDLVPGMGIELETYPFETEYDLDFS